MIFILIHYQSFLFFLIKKSYKNLISRFLHLCYNGGNTTEVTVSGCGVYY